MTAQAQPYQDPANGNRWTIDKDPDDIRFYYGDVTKDLTDMGTTIASVMAVVTGVVIASAADFSGSICRVKLSGMDITANAVNSVTFRVTCANTEQFDRTIYFNKVDK